MSEHSRLLWRCRRGIREMDIVFTDFIEHCYDSLNETEKQSLEQLLDEPDLDILNWVMGKSEPESDSFKHLISLIKQRRSLDISK